MEKIEASKRSPPEPEEAPTLDLGLHPVTVPTTPTTPVWYVPPGRMQTQPYFSVVYFDHFSFSYPKVILKNIILFQNGTVEN